MRVSPCCGAVLVTLGQLVSPPIYIPSSLSPHPSSLSPHHPPIKVVEALMQLEADLKFRSWAYGRQADPFCK